MTNKHREDYDIEDFLTDESFINYHLQADTAHEQSWVKWVAENPDKREFINQAKTLADSLSLKLSDSEFDRELKKITSIINTEKGVSTFQLLKPNGHYRKAKLRKRLLVLALPVTAILIAGAILFDNYKKSFNEFVHTINKEINPIVITLSDSTIVTLGPSGELKYQKRFLDNQRNVYLKGNARFSVKRNEKAPFKVYSENMIATVLGTVFTFSKLKDSTIIELLSGSLNVEINNNVTSARPIHLSPKDKAIYVNNNKNFYRKPYLKPVDIYFNKNDFDEIAAQFKNVFAVTLINNSNKKLWRFTGDFKHTTAEDVVESICQVKGLRHTTKGDTIFIKQRTELN